jgi:hypothetical protein
VNLNIKFLAYILVAAMILGSIPFAFQNETSNGSSGILPYSLSVHNVNIYITNPGVNISSPFDEMIVVNSTIFSAFENHNLSNVYFTYSNGTVLPSWLESGNSVSENNTTYWLRINQTIPKGQVLEVHMNFLPLGQIAFNNYSAGEAPELSSVYAYYDDGSHVFPFYSNFSGTALNSNLWNTSFTNSNYISVNNSINFTGPDQLSSHMTFDSPVLVDGYGIINTPLGTNDTTCFLNGAGLGNPAIDNSNPVLTSGWAENNTNWLGMSVWNGNGLSYTYNYSKSIDPYKYHTFGVALVNSSYSEGLVDNTVQNASHISVGTSSLHVVLGFQSENRVKNFTFDWIFATNISSTGENLPYSYSASVYDVQIKATGLPSNAPWFITIQGVSTYALTGDAPISLSLINGTYNYTILSLNKSYAPAQVSGNFTIDGASKVVVIQFHLVVYDVIFYEYGLPTGVNWSLNVSGNALTTKNSSLVDALPNGTYKVSILDSNGYVSLPETMNITVNGQNIETEVFFEAQQDLKYLKPDMTLFPLQNISYSGIYANYGGQFSTETQAIFSTALNTVTNVLYIDFAAKGEILSKNLSTGQNTGSVVFSQGNVPYKLIFDNYTNYLYVLGFSNITGNISLTTINPQGLHIVNTVNLKVNIANVSPSIQMSLDPAELDNIFITYVNTSTYEINMIDMNPTNSSFVTFAIGQFNKSYDLILEVKSLFTQHYTIKNNTLIFPNVTSIILVNILNGKYTDVSVPSLDYYVTSNVELGNSPTYVVGTYNETNMLLFNLSNRTYFIGPKSSGIVYAGTYNPFSGYEYIESNTLQQNGSIQVIGLRNDSVLASVQSNMLDSFTFDPNGQLLLVATSYFLLSEGYGNSIEVYYTQKAYQETFVEAGLPTGTIWYVNLSNGVSSGPISTGSVSFYLTNGSYSYHISTNDKTYEATPLSGTFNVNGSSNKVSVTFSKVKYSVVFSETGLPSGTTWSIELSGITISSSGSSISTSLTNGSYQFTASTQNSSFRSVYSPNFTVDGSSVSVEVTFNPVLYSVTFVETGLSSGTTWQLVANGTLFNVSGQSKVVEFINGSYSYSVRSISGYTITNQTGKIVVSGHNLSVYITFKKSGFSTIDYVLIAVAVVVVVALALMVVTRRKK